MTGYILSPRAQADIEDIWDYTVVQWGIDQAEHYIGDIKTAINLIAANPLNGRSCGNVRVGYNKYAVGSHVIFYRIMDDAINIIRILHQRMDYARHI